MNKKRPSKETFELPKLKEFEMTIHFHSDKPNRITYDENKRLNMEYESFNDAPYGEDWDDEFTE